jgi:transposase
MDEYNRLKEKYNILRPYLNEATMRACLAADALTLGRGGPVLVARASGFSRTTIYAGMREINEKEGKEALIAKSERVRRFGGGRKRITESVPNLLEELEKLVSPVTRGDPESSLCWTCKSTAKLAKELQSQGFQVSQHTVWALLDELGYSMQSNQKTREGNEHADRDKQFLYISNKVRKVSKRERSCYFCRYKEEGINWSF